MRKAWTQDEFFTWRDQQEGRYEFDGFAPVDMNGVPINHAIIVRNISTALTQRLRGTPCQALGPDIGLATTGNALRYPDMLVTCAKLDGNARLVPGAVIIFEVLSPSSGRTDRIHKVREYAGVASVRRYVIVESSGVGLTVFERTTQDAAWQANTLSADDLLEMPEIGISVTVSEIYEAVAFDG